MPGVRGWSPASGALIPMSDLATIEMREGPLRISREQVKRRIYIGFNVVGRDIGGVVDEGRRKLVAQIRLPEGTPSRGAGPSKTWSEPTRGC